MARFRFTTGLNSSKLMFVPVFCSFILHVFVGVIGYIGWPLFQDNNVVMDETVMVEIVTVEEITNIPELAPEPPPDEEIAKNPAPPLEPEAPKSEQLAALMPEPEPEPEPEPKKKPAPEPTVPAASPKLALKKAKVIRKPRPPKKFKVAALKDLLAEIKKTKPAEQESQAKDRSKSFHEKISKAISGPKKKYDLNRAVTISEIDSVRQQIMRCWNVPAGSKNAEDMQIEISVDMNPDGTVRKAKIMDVNRLFSDEFFRTAAESARRAVLNPRCSPLKLPREKYNYWRTITLNFNPREMF